MEQAVKRPASVRVTYARAGKLNNLRDFPVLAAALPYSLDSANVASSSGMTTARFDEMSEARRLLQESRRAATAARQCLRRSQAISHGAELALNRGETACADAARSPRAAASGSHSGETR